MHPASTDYGDSGGQSIVRKRRWSHVRLDNGMSREEIASALERMVFTASREWHRTVVIDRNVRDIIVMAMRAD